MARIKFGALVTSGSGSVGGHTVQNSKGGMQLRTKPSYKGRPSFAQSLIRSLNSKLQEGWRLLTDAQRKEWDTFAFSHSVSNQKGTDHFISGHSLYLKYNFQFARVGSNLVVSPFDYAPLTFGSNIISNPYFVDSSFWFLRGDWSISAGKAHCAALVSDFMYQTFACGTGCRFWLSFDISGCTGSAHFWFFGNASVQLFEAPFNTYRYLSNGHYYFLVTTKVAATQFRIYALDSGDSFSLDNLLLLPIIA